MEFPHDRQQQMHQRVDHVQGTQRHLDDGMNQAFSTTENQIHQIQGEERGRSASSQIPPNQAPRTNLPLSPTNMNHATSMDCRSFPSFLSPINHPPSFDINNYSNWQEEICFRRDAQSHVKWEQLVAERAFSSSKAYRPATTRFIRDTAMVMDRRTISNVLFHLSKNSSKMQLIDQWGSFKSLIHSKGIMMKPSDHTGYGTNDLSTNWSAAG